MVRLPIPAAVGSAVLPGQWGVTLLYESMGVLILDVQVPVSAPVGRWTMTVVAGGQVAFTFRKPIYIIFNPWSPEDLVYMPDDLWRTFYTMQDIGAIFHGALSVIFKKKWYYGQFDKVVLPAAEFLMKIKQLTPAQRSDPIAVVRAMSAAVNSNDENGTVIGRWDRQYSDGIHPYSWSSSPTLLNKYMESGGNAVKYGQCLVFGGVLTTLLRGLGVPSRTITNFDSGHLEPGNDYIHFYFNSKGQLYSSIGSIWNYHVWTECWLNRTNLPANFSGWQIVDGTPQTPSAETGYYEVGPFPTNAVLLDRTDVPYDGTFTRAAVKAPCKLYGRDASKPGGWRLTMVVRDSVGHLVVTEAMSESPGDGNMEDITATYKRALAIPRQSEETPIQITLKHSATVELGETVVIACTVANKDVKAHQVNMAVTATSVTYNTWNPIVVGSKTASVNVAPGSAESIELQIPPEMYIGKLHVEGTMKVDACAMLSETLAVAKGLIFVKMPGLNVHILPSSRVPGEVHFQLTLRNPLKTPLTHCELILELPTSTRLLEKIPLGDIPVGGRFEKAGMLFADSPDTKELIATFMSLEIPYVQATGAI
ncbi:unnamed protein product [Ixodes hexagonus]